MQADLKNVLILFPNEWDRVEFGSRRYASTFKFFFEGFDLHKFPENARLLTFDATKFIERMIAKYRGVKLDGILSNEEQFGTLIAAVIGERLRLPSASPHAILTCQHKFYARLRSREIASELTPSFTVFPYQIARETDLGLGFPMFVKPVKATFSILARRVDDFFELKRHLTFGPLETLILKKLVQPANDLARHRTDFNIDTMHILAEEVLDGAQATVDGYIHAGQVHVLGIVDSIMYPGTSAFQRFEYPSKLPQPVQLRMAESARRLVEGFGLDYGLFNVEFFHEPRTDSLKMIEINPRMAYQFADLYEKVDGFNPYDILLALATGTAPVVSKRLGVYNHAASFILRAFPGSGELKAAPSKSHLQRIRAQHQDARIQVYIKKGASLAREFKWLGSYRYAIVNIGAKTNQDLFHRFHTMRNQLPFEFA